MRWKPSRIPTAVVAVVALVLTPRRVAGLGCRRRRSGHHHRGRLGSVPGRQRRGAHRPDGRRRSTTATRRQPALDADHGR